MKHIAIAVAALAAFTLTASAASMETVAIGCSDYKDYKALIGFAVDKDREAYMKYATSHDCKVFAKAAKVIVSDPGVMTSCIRERGDPTCYWVSNAAIDRLD